MKQSTPPTLRRTAAFGAAVALVAVSSVIGIGTTAAVADTAETSATSTSAATTATASDGTMTNGTGSDAAAPTTVVEPAAPTTDPATDATPTPTADPADTADSTDATPAGGDTADGTDPAPASGKPAESTNITSDAAPAADAAVTWDQPSSPSNRIVYTVTAGSDFSHQFVAHGGDGPLEYGFAPSIGFDALEWFSWGDDGLLRGKPTVVGAYDFDVLATDTRNTATQYVRIEVEPAAAKSISAEVYSGTNGEMPAWGVSDGGGVAPVGGGGLIDAIPVDPGGSRWMDAVVVDRFGNPLNGPEMASESTVTSSDASDTLVYDDARNLWKVTFPDAGPRTLTMTSEGLTVTIPVSVEDTTLVFAGSSTSNDVRITAGRAFSEQFRTTGGIEPVRYSLQYSDGSEADPTQTDARIPDHLTLDRETGVLSGTPTIAGDYRFGVVATSGTQSVRRVVHVVVTPGATTHLQTFISPNPQLLGNITWGYGPGDQLIRIDGTGESATHEDVDSIPVRQGDSLYVKTTPMDAWGNATAPVEPAPGDPAPKATSSVRSDQITFLPSVWSTQIRFPHASDHTITVTLDGATSTFDVSVTPASSDGSLAYTGADESAPLAWALGLLASGAGLFVWRVRRRHG